MAELKPTTTTTTTTQQQQQQQQQQQLSPFRHPCSSNRTRIATSSSLYGALPWNEEKLQAVMGHELLNSLHLTHSPDTVCALLVDTGRGSYGATRERAQGGAIRGKSSMKPRGTMLE